MIIDWEAEQERVVYPQGTYKVVIDSFDRGESGVKGTPYLLVKTKILEPEEHKDRTLTCFLYLTAPSIWRLQRFVGAAGINAKGLGKTDDTSPQFEAVLNACIGRKMSWYVTETKDDKGMPKNDIGDFINDVDEEEIVVSMDDGAGANVKWDE